MSPTAVRVALLCVFGLPWAAAVQGQQAPFVRITGPNAPKGAAYLFQDSHGGLWLGGCEAGAEGLTYFDGNRFISPVSDFPKMGITGMAEDSDGAIWLAAAAGLYRVYRGRLEKVVDGIAITGITKVAPDVFLATVGLAGKDPVTSAKLVRVARAQNQWKAETIVRPVPSVWFRIDHLGNVLYRCEGGFCELRVDQIVNWRPGAALAITRRSMPALTGFTAPTAVSRDRFGCLWMRSLAEASYQCPNNSRPIALPASVASLVGAPQILESGDGSVVIPSFGKLAIGRPGKFRVLTALNGYPSTGYALIAKDGSIWLSNANGLFVFPAHLRMEFWTERDGLDGNTWSVLRMGTKVFAVAGDTIRVLDQDRSRWRLFVNLAGAMHLLPGPDNTLLAGSQSGGVVQISLKGDILRSSNSNRAVMLARTSDGEYWMSGSTISRIALSGRRLNLQSASVLAPQSPVDMKVDQDGGVWTCDVRGLIRKGVSGWQVISNAEGFLENHCLSFAIDQRGDIWHTYGSQSTFSLIRIPKGDKPLLLHFSNGDELGPGQNNFFNFDRRGWLWRGTANGIYVADPNQALQGQWLELNRTDGLPAIDANQRSFFEDPDGSVWFGADNSVIHLFPPDDLVQPRYSPSIFVSAFSRDGGTPEMANTVDAIKSGSRITAHIGSLQFDRRNALRLRYRLLPEQTSWKLERSLDIPLRSLPWGKHELEVQGRLGTGPWSGTAKKSFVVLKPIWFSWTALIGFAAAGSIIAAGGHGWRMKRKERAKKGFPELAEWRLAALSPEVQRLEGASLDSRFEVGRILARGGFATVVEGRDLQQGSTPCAIKIFRQELLDKAWLTRRFQQEVLALAKIHHPNVVRIYGHGTTPAGAPYLVMEFIEGKTLRDLLEETSVARWQAASYLRQAGSALDEIHGHGICHRDLKPENLMIRHAGAPGQELVLIDFSIAIVKDPDETVHGLSRAAGTLYYMAPEQAIGYADTSTDIYSLAKIVIETLTRQRLSTLLPNASMDLPARVRELLRELPLALSSLSIDLISAALEFDPSRRPKNAGEFAAPIARDLELAPDPI